MGGPVDHLDSKNLVPFKKRRNGYRLPGLTKQEEEKVIDEVDPDLRPEEQGYVRHYLGYADVMLKSSEAEEEKSAEEKAQSGEETGAEQENAAELEESELAEEDAGNTRKSAPPEAAAGKRNAAKGNNVTEMPQRRKQDSNAA